MTVHVGVRVIIVCRPCRARRRFRSQSCSVVQCASRESYRQRVLRALDTMDNELLAFLRSRKLESSAATLAAGGVKSVAAFNALSMSELKRIGMKDLAERKRVMLVVRETGSAFLLLAGFGDVRGFLTRDCATVDDMVDSTTEVSIDDSATDADNGSAVTFSPRGARLSVCYVSYSLMRQLLSGALHGQHVAAGKWLPSVRESNLNLSHRAVQ